MFYDWSNPVDATWLKVASEIFAVFGESIAQATGNCEGRHSHGTFSRNQKRIKSFMNDGAGKAGANYGVRLRSALVGNEDGFFPSDIEIAASVSSSGQKEGAIMVRENRIDNLASLTDRIVGKVLQAAGDTYAFCLDFPANYGPGGYLAGVGGMPYPESTLENREYYGRITRWRDMRWKGFSPSQGLMREVYEINFLLPAHLEMSFGGKQLSEYAKTRGSLEQTTFNNKIYQWTLPIDQMKRVREDMEASGLILSAPCPPRLSSVQ